MRASIVAMVAVLLACGSAQAGTEWRVRIHDGGETSEFPVSHVDSLTLKEVPKMVWIPEGYVRLGQSGIATPVHDVWVDGFWIDIHPVTNSEYRRFIEAGGYGNPEWWSTIGWAFRVGNAITLPLNWNSIQHRGGGAPAHGRFPVTGVSWWEAEAYANWAGKRLPTEAEWEKAAKGGCEIWGDPDECDASDTPTYPWGEWISGERANYAWSGDPYEGWGSTYTTPVGYYDGSDPHGFQTIDSPSPYGLYDAAGNVFEWTSTRHASYPYDPDDGREDPPLTWNECCRVLRGGAWNEGTVYLQCASRYLSNTPDTRPSSHGFRCARD